MRFERNPWLLVGALVALAQIGCNSTCSGNYNCPAGGAEVIVPANLPAPLTTVTADPPCSIASTGPYTGGPIFVNISGERTGTCEVRAALANGAEMTASVSFAPLMCCGLSYGLGAATLSFVDAGTSDAASAD